MGYGLATCVSVLTCAIYSTGVKPNIPAAHIAAEACRHASEQVPAELLIAIMWHESRLRHWRSPTKNWDWGIMQLHCPPNDGRSVKCDTCNIKELGCNVFSGASLLRRLHRKYFGRYKSRWGWLQHYNYNSAGYGKRVMERLKWVKRLRSVCELNRSGKPGLDRSVPRE